MVKHLFNSRPNPHEAKGPYSQDTKLGHGKPLFKIEDEPGIPHCLGNPSKNNWHFERVHDLAPSDSSPTNHHPQRFSKLRTEDHIVVGLAGLAHRMILLWQKLSTLKLVFSCFVEKQWRQKNGCRFLLKDTAPLNGNVDKYKFSTA